MAEAALPAAVVVTAAGSSSRMGDGAKKEYRPLDGMTVLARAVLPFVTSRRFTRIVVTIPQGHRQLAADALAPLLPRLQESGFPPEGIRLAEGGGTRQESVFRGILELEDAGIGAVLIHDGARPWVTETLILRVLGEVERTGAAVPVLPTVEAVKGIDANGRVVAHYLREQTVAAQTPQGFRYDGILAAHRNASGDGHLYIDDAEVYGRYIGFVSTVPGEPMNRKITFPEDLRTR